MTNYIDEIYTVRQFQSDCPMLAEQAEKALNNLRAYFPIGEDDDFVVITVEGYKCVAYVADDFAPYILAERIAPFDENKIYPMQGLETEFCFKRY